MIGTFGQFYGDRAPRPHGFAGPGSMTVVSRYADVTTAEGAGGAGQPTWLQALTPVAGEIVERATTDPYKKVEVLEAQLRAAISRRASALTIDTLAGKLRAARRELALYEESIKSSREWSGLGKTAAVLGIGFLTVVTFAVLRRSVGR